MFEPIEVVTTAPHRGDAENIARALVGQHLAACVQIGGPIASVYRWEGAVETNQEWVCTIKTDQTKYEAVEQTICRLHPYDVPQIVAFPITGGSQGYRDWLRESLM